MRIFSGKVMGGVIVPEATGPLREGMTVSVAADDGETSFTASPEEEAELLAALEDPAEPLPASEVLNRLR